MQTVWGRLLIVDVAHPDGPSLVGSYDAFRMATDLALAGSVAYVTDGQCEWGWLSCVGSLHLIDVTDPRAPVLLSRYDLEYPPDGIPLPTEALPFSGWYGNAVTVDGAYAYVSGGTYHPGYGGPCGLRVFDVSRPQDPVPLASLTCRNDQRAWAASELLLSGNLLYAAAGSDGLYTIDVSDPANPAEVAHEDLPGGAWGLAIDAGFLYVASGYEGLLIYEMRDAHGLRSAARVATPGPAIDVTLEDHYAVVASHGEGIHVYDVSDPSLPSEAAQYQTRSTIYSVESADGLVYAADLERGMYILRIPDDAP